VELLEALIENKPFLDLRLFYNLHKIKVEVDQFHLETIRIGLGKTIDLGYCFLPFNKPV